MRTKTRNRRGLVAGAALALTGAVVALPSAPAEAAVIGACHGPMWNFQADVCVYIMSGGYKDYANHREWIGQVQVANRNGNPGLLEMWGQGFYYSTRSTVLTINVNRWVPSGSNVCGALGPSGVGDSREVVCLNIRV